MSQLIYITKKIIHLAVFYAENDHIDGSSIYPPLAAGYVLIGNIHATDQRESANMTTTCGTS
jgi:hypothetical protein